jgi:hypothetical protein
LHGTFWICFSWCIAEKYIPTVSVLLCTSNMHFNSSNLLLSLQCINSLNCHIFPASWMHRHTLG